MSSAVPASAPEPDAQVSDARRRERAARVKVGVQLQPQHTSIERYRAAWREADQLRLDSLWTWDHFLPVDGDPDGPHFEGWSLLAAMAVDTMHPRIGVLVSCNGYRNPDLLAHMAQTVSLLSGGRAILGLGAGWFEREYAEYGFDFGPTASRLKALDESLPRIRARLAKVRPSVPDLPILVGGTGERVTLRIVAQHADLWNFQEPTPEAFIHKSAVLARWCDRIGRDPGEIEHTATIQPSALGHGERLLDAGVEHLILELRHPFDFTLVDRLLELAR